MDNDDVLTGQLLSRREAVRVLAVTGAAVLTGCQRGGSGGAESPPAANSPRAAAGTALPACVARPEMTAGPFFVDQQMERSDIRAEPTTGIQSAGAPLALAFTVCRISGGRCTPIAGAIVDVWQCDAKGLYSGVSDRMAGTDTVGEKFLRGYQRTDSNGVARFVTIYPGWYPGRTVHIHFTVRAPGAAANRTYEFTSQLFFDDTLTDRVHAQAPYSAKGRRDTTNTTDGIYRNVGDQLLLAAASDGEGYRASFTLGLDF